MLKFKTMIEDGDAVYGDAKERFEMRDLDLLNSTKKKDAGMREATEGMVIVMARLLDKKNAEAKARKAAKQGVK